MFGRKSFKQWQQEGKDKESLIADPGFVDAEHYDFRFKNKKLQKAIGFMPFNYSDAGVYGSAEWKKKAEMDQALMKEYDERVKELELRKNEH
jgi:stalled ribosome rescue protein Dom34